MDQLSLCCTAITARFPNHISAAGISTASVHRMNSCKRVSVFLPPSELPTDLTDMDPRHRKTSASLAPTPLVCTPGADPAESVAYRPSAAGGVQAVSPMYGQKQMLFGGCLAGQCWEGEALHPRARR